MLIDLQGHVLIHKHPSLSELVTHAVGNHLLPFSVSDEGEYYQLSHPLSAKERVEYKWLYARKAAENKLKEAEEPEDDGPGPMLA
ncbi:hypothetical protein CNR37_00146 [Pseudomonas phage ventosus]|uniref:Uncharacterized protein n=1 Tax=Pseudomonas phage ventosus TaxID=2048980 RepID=A0A2H4P838_9CAUD|nr:hypothetical protein CNR37_00146 [Pseudomonas phage ventosus]